jgi:polar amino acid transport system substrate-binding protein
MQARRRRVDAARIALGWALLAFMAAREVLARDACPHVVIAADPSHPPLHWYDGQAFQGASIELTSRVLNQLGVSHEFRYVGPWPRVLQQARAGKIDMVATLKDSPDRRGYLAYPATTAFTDPIVVFVAKGHEFPYAGPGDLGGRVGGISRGERLGGTTGRALEEMLRLEEGRDASHNFAKLALGRIDYFITGLHAGLAQQQVWPEAQKFSMLTPNLHESPNYVGFVKTSPCVQHLARFEEALARLHRSGEVAGILERHLRLWAASQPRPVSFQGLPQLP